jgi:hypothetical protein
LRALDPEPVLDEKTASTVKTKTLALALLLLPAPALAQTTEEWDGAYGLRTERRGGFAMGADFGLGFGNVQGYPNDALKLDDPRYESDTGFALGTSGKAWMGGNPRDWFGFALGFELLKVKGNDLEARGGAFILRTEIYPLWQLGRWYRDLGVYGDFGLGVLRNREGDVVRADGGSVGVLGLGVFHETLRLGNLTLGPTVGYSAYFSETITGHLGQLGIRASFTTSP